MLSHRAESGNIFGRHWAASALVLSLVVLLGSPVPALASAAKLNKIKHIVVIYQNRRTIFFRRNGQ